MGKRIIRLTESDVHRIILETVDEVVKQSFGSSATSINSKAPASGFGFFGGTVLDKNGNPKWKGEPAFSNGAYNLDIGGGKFDNAHEYMSSNFGATNLVFDPFSRDAKHNGAIFSKVEELGGADSVTCFNCLNVIREPEVRDNVILQCSQVLKPNGKAYFQVYSDKKRFRERGSGQTGADQWQEFRGIETYIPEIEKHFGKVTRYGAYLVAEQPLDSDVDAEWHMDGSGTNFKTMRRFR